MRKNEARQKLIELEKEVTKLNETIAAKKELIESHPCTQIFQDFLDGLITHYVCIRYNGAVIRKSDDKELFGDTREQERKLITLFGREPNNHEWKINEYSDGSGGWHEIIPCKSLEDAKDAVQKWINKEVEHGTTMSQRAEYAEKHGYECPQKYKDVFNASRKKSLQTNVETAEKTLKEKKQTLREFKEIK